MVELFKKNFVQYSSINERLPPDFKTPSYANEPAVYKSFFVDKHDSEIRCDFVKFQRTRNGKSR